VYGFLLNVRYNQPKLMQTPSEILIQVRTIEMDCDSAQADKFPILFLCVACVKEKEG
jgi:hypothetical protein